MDYNIEDDFFLPKRSDGIYQEIDSYEDYEFRNNIAFEVLIRTSVYHDLLNMEYSERIIAAKQLGFNELDSKFAGLPWMIFKVLRNDTHKDKEGNNFDLKSHFRLLISIYSEKYNLKDKFNLFEQLSAYYLLNEKFPLNEILFNYDIEDIHLLSIIIDGYYKIALYYLYKTNNINNQKDIENSFSKLFLSCIETSTYVLEDIIDDTTIEENILDGYLNKNSYKLEDIHNGLDKLITYYIKEGKVFTYTGQKVKHMNKNIILENLDKCRYVWVSKNNGYSQDYILLLSESEKSFGSTKESDAGNSIVSNILNFKFMDYESTLSVSLVYTDISLYNLKDFVSQLKQCDIKNKKEIINLKFKRPLLTIHENNINKIEVDMNLPYKDFMDFMKNIKNEYDKNNNIVKNTSVLINKESEIKDATLTKKNIANAFYCYDYYHMRLNQTKIKNNKLKEENKNNPTIQRLEKEIEQINNLDLSVSMKDQIRSDKEYKIYHEAKELIVAPALYKGSPNFVFKEKNFENSGIQPHSASSYYSKIASYIDNELYNEIMTDVK